MTRAELARRTGQGMLDEGRGGDDEEVLDLRLERLQRALGGAHLAEPPERAAQLGAVVGR